MIDYLLPILMVIFGLTLGATFPDIDLAPLPLWRHRSVWTHGPLFSLIALWIAAIYPSSWPFWAAFLPALTVHIFKDMFPDHWHGGALIKLYPIPGNLGPVMSFLYLGLGLAGAVYAFFTITPAAWGITMNFLNSVAVILVGSFNAKY